MWAYFFLSLLGFFLSTLLSSLLELLYMPTPPLVAFHAFGGQGPVIYPHTQAVFVMKDEEVFVFMAEIGDVTLNSPLRIYETNLSALTCNQTLRWKSPWESALPGKLYFGGQGYNSSDLVLVYTAADGSTVINYWPSIRYPNHSQFTVKSRVTALSFFNSTLLYSLSNDSSLFHTLKYDPSLGLSYLTHTPKSADFSRHELIGAILTPFAGFTWATAVSYVRTADSSVRQLEFYLLNGTEWFYYDSYSLSEENFVRST
jgi:hypothetical protein